MVRHLRLLCRAVVVAAAALHPSVVSTVATTFVSTAVSTAASSSASTAPTAPTIVPSETRCAVCGDSGAISKHYGVNACLGECQSKRSRVLTRCRLQGETSTIVHPTTRLAIQGFFRRSLKRGNLSIYECLNSNNCLIQGQSRTSCRSCRFNKCIAAGMSAGGQC